MPSFTDFQGAVSKALNGWPALSAIVGTRIFDDVPHGSEALNTQFPRISIGDQVGTEAGSDTHDAADIMITLHAWSRSPGRKELLDMLNACIGALHNKSHFVANGVLVFLLYDGHETMKDPDGETYHGVIRFRGLHQFG